MPLLTHAHEHPQEIASLSQHGHYGSHRHNLVPMLMRKLGNWDIMLQGWANLIFDHQGGPRGATTMFSSNIFMMKGEREVTHGKVGATAMLSLDPITMNKCGYPLLLQTGETCDGITPLIDRQHPHDLFMELSTEYNHAIDDDLILHIYFGLPGDPALGPPIFVHRYSAIYNPEAPITHHWLDSTHISWGVLTGALLSKHLDLEASWFTGREPDEERFNIENPNFDSWSMRLKCRPWKNIELQVSHGFLTSPEQLEPEINVARTTASVQISHENESSVWQFLFAWGRNKNEPGRASNAFLAEWTWELHQRHIFFARAEHLTKNELFCPTDERAELYYPVGKIQAGYLFEIPGAAATWWSLGISGSICDIPFDLKKTYGNHPFSFEVFVRCELR